MRTDSWQRLSGSYHGSGCTLASAIAAMLANGLELPEAVREAQDYTWHALQEGVSSRHGPVPARPPVLGARGRRARAGGEPELPRRAPMPRSTPLTRHDDAAARASAAPRAGSTRVTPDLADTRRPRGARRRRARRRRGGDPVSQQDGGSLALRARAGARARAACTAIRGGLFIVNDDVALAVRRRRRWRARGRGRRRHRRCAREIARARPHRSASPATTISRAREAAVAAGADYVAFGSFFASTRQAGRARAPTSIAASGARALGRAGRRDRRHHRRQRADAGRAGADARRGDLRRCSARPTSRPARARSRRLSSRPFASNPMHAPWPIPKRAARRRSREPAPMSRNDELFARAQRTIPAGVNSPVRAFRSVGGTPRFFDARRGRLSVGRRRQALHRLRRLVGPGDPRSRASRRSCAPCSDIAPNGLSFGAPTEIEIEMAETLCRLLAVDRDGAPRVVGHRGDDDGAAARARLHGPQQDRQVRRLLSRPRRQPAGEGGLGRADLRPAVVGGRARGDRGRDDRAAVQRSRRGRSGLRGGRAGDRRHHRRADRRQHESDRAAARVPAGSARAVRSARRRADLRRGDDRLSRARARRAGTVRASRPTSRRSAR